MGLTASGQTWDEASSPASHRVARRYEAAWRETKGRRPDPDDFLPMAEQTGLIVPLGWWMLATCCKVAGDARLTGGSAQWVAVNASGSQLGRGQLVSEIRRGLELGGLTPDRLHLEITESALVEASPAAIREYVRPARPRAPRTHPARSSCGLASGSTVSGT